MRAAAAGANSMLDYNCPYVPESAHNKELEKWITPPP